MRELLFFLIALVLIAEWLNFPLLLSAFVSQ